jgi:hypothetical protein
MRWNEGEVSLLAQQTPSWEGKLTYVPPKNKTKSVVGGALSGIWSGTSGSSNDTRDRWFRLRTNSLFYFRLTSAQGRPPLGAEPLGVFILESFHVQPEGFETPNAFSIIFAEDSNKKHLFIAETERSAKQWEAALKDSSYERLRDRLINLQIILRQKTGCDPLRGTSFENNPLFSPAAVATSFPIQGCGLEFADATSDGDAPPKPKPRKPKQKSTFQSHVVENWESHSPAAIRRHENDDDDDKAGGEPMKLRKASFQSHVPVANLLDL